MLAGDGAFSAPAFAASTAGDFAGCPLGFAGRPGGGGRPEGGAFVLPGGAGNDDGGAPEFVLEALGALDFEVCSSWNVPVNLASVFDRDFA